MDPHAALAELRQAVRDYQQSPSGENALVAADTFTERFEALDEWLSKGGFLPRDWVPNGHR